MGYSKKAIKLDGVKYYLFPRDRNLVMGRWNAIAGQILHWRKTQIPVCAMSISFHLSDFIAEVNSGSHKRSITPIVVITADSVDQAEVH